MGELYKTEVRVVYNGEWSIDGYSLYHPESLVYKKACSGGQSATLWTHEKDIWEYLRRPHTSSYMEVFRCGYGDKGTDYWTDWYDTEQDAVNALNAIKPKECYWPHHWKEIGTLYSRSTRPLNPGAVVMLKESSAGDGKLFCTYDEEPYLLGCNSEKRYFIDKLCREKLCVGKAIVDQVKDKGTYGFIHCHMKQYQYPINSDIVKYFQQPHMSSQTRADLESNGRVEFIHTPYIGDYVKVTFRYGGTWSSTFYMVDADPDPVHTDFHDCNHETGIAHYERAGNPTEIVQTMTWNEFVDYAYGG